MGTESYRQRPGRCDRRASAALAGAPTLAAVAVMAMFPLGTVLFPGQVLPLHVFEPRYQALLRDCLAGDREFGVVLIERGSEVGGGDQRSDVGTVAQIVQTQELPGGRWGVAAMGTRRIRVRSWLADDPYPRAEVDDWPDGAATDESRVELAGVYAERSAALRRLLALCAELGVSAAPSTVDLPDDPAVGSLVLAGLAPLGSFDRQALLAAPDPGRRLDLLGPLLHDQRTLLEADLGASGGASPG